MNKGRILIVENEATIAKEIFDIINPLGYEVIKIVTNGNIAIETAKNSMPDLILIDITLPGDIDGIETIARIHEFLEVPVIYLSADADDVALERAKVSDDFDCLTVPFEENEVNISIEMALYKHRMDSKVKESEQRFKSLVENSIIGMFRLSKEGRILHGNSTFIKLFGFNKLNEIVGRKIDEFIEPVSDEGITLSDLFNSKESIKRLKMLLENNTGNKVIVSLSGNVLKWENEVLYFDGTIEDITKQQLYEDELIKAKEKAERSDKLKTEFLAGMSHEIRTPINTIMSYLSLLDTDLNSKGNYNYKEIFDAIQIGSLRLTRTIDSILNMAQFQSGTFDVFKTKIDVVEDVIKNLYDEFKYTAKQRGLELRYLNNTKNARILGDQYSLYQLFANLIDNGLKYTKEGHVEIKIFNDENGALSVNVEDSGIGIGEEFLPTLFQPFTQEEQGYTRKYDGNGLGLALVGRYCELNDAVITVKSKKGEGTKFTVKFLQTNKKYKHLTQKDFQI